MPYPGSGAAVPAYAYPGSKPRETLQGPERPLTREQFIQGQAVLDKINNLPHFLRDQFISRHSFLLANKGLLAANKWLIFVFEQRIWPRIQVVNTKNFMVTKYLREFSLEPEDYDKLPGLHNKELRRLARQISDELMMFFDHYCDQCVATNQGDRSILLTLGTQMRVFGKLGRFARAFHVTPMHWRKYLKGRLDITSAIASLSRLVNPEWWERKLKAQRTRWREALLIAVGNVSRDMSASSYASKQAIREVFARRQSNLEYLKSCQLENIETGELLTDSAAAVTAWAATWRIPQFRPMGIPSMGAYRECRRIRFISLAESFDETVEAVRHAADEGDFAAYIAAQGGTNSGNQTVRVAKRIADELNAYDEEVQKVVGIYAPHLGADHVHETRTTQWRIVSGAVDVEPLTLKSASGAPRSPVNNCGLGGNTQATNDPNGEAKTPVMAMEYPPDAVIDWSDTAAVKAIVARVKEKQPTISKMQRSYDPTKGRLIAPSARLTREERQRIPQIRNDLLLKDISAQRWVLESLARGAKMSVGDAVIHYPALSDWPEFDD
ncbi:replication endonuclease [Yersinia enterocolitica]|nr:replication endonuclease [Yersinia enterocolitica]